MSSLPRWPAVLLVVLVSACAASSPSLKAAPAAPSAAGVPDWLLPVDVCPADVIGARTIPTEAFAGRCAGELLDGCLERCRAEDVNACYAAALEAEEREAPDHPGPLAEALFLRACRLGFASGCTNVAARRFDPDAPGAAKNRCATRSFEAACTHLDPWGCTMFAQSLVHGIGVARDVARARDVLPGGCRLGEDDDACKAAHELLAEIDGPAAYPEVSGEYAMTEDWKVQLATPVRRRIEKGSLVLWRPGFTVWVNVWGAKPGEPVDQRLADLEADASPQRFDVLKEQDGGLTRFAYRLADGGTDARRPALHGFVLGPTSHVQLAIYFDDEAELPAALALWRSVAPR
jgi:hypothetical protein